MSKNVTTFGGLSRQEAGARLRREGLNELPSAKPRRAWNVALEIVKEPMIILLLVTGGLYLALGSKLEAGLLLLSVFGIMGISFYEENKSEQSLRALNQLASPQAVVIRDGQEWKIPSREVVRGDLVRLMEGDRVPADVRLLKAVNLNTDESLLTGESRPVEKRAEGDGDGSGAPSAAAYSGSLVVRGHGVGQVTAVGQNTDLGKIGKSLNSIKISRTPLQREMAVFVKWLAVAGVGLCVLLTAVYALTRGQLVTGILAGLALAMSILPEEFPIVLLLFLTLGAWRLAKHNVLTRRAATIETLGAATVLCVDKTGTITRNKTSIARVILDGGGVVTGDFSDSQELIKYGVLASQRRPFDPMDTAFIDEGQKLFGLDKLYGQFELAREYPLEVGSLNVAHAYKVPGDGYEVALKGSPESIVELCRLRAPANCPLATAITRSPSRAKSRAFAKIRRLSGARSRHSSTIDSGDPFSATS